MLRICAHASYHYDFKRVEIGEFGLQQTISKSAKRTAVHNLRNMTGYLGYVVSRRHAFPGKKPNQILACL